MISNARPRVVIYQVDVAIVNVLEQPLQESATPEVIIHVRVSAKIDLT